MFSKEELQSGLDTEVFGKKIYVYDSIDSTNACAKVLAGTGAEEGAIVIADYQTAGRGRQGRTWQSESGRNLLFSLLIRPKLDISSVGLLPFFAAAGAANAVEAITGSRCECKWPNDVLLNGKKCCGILMESSFQNNMFDYAVAGIGLNVNQDNFQGELGSKATSLRKEFKREFDRKSVFQQLIKSLESLYTDVRSGNFAPALKEWKNRALLFGKEIIVHYDNRDIAGVAVDITADGGLIIDSPDGRRTFYSGDVTVIKSR